MPQNTDKSAKSNPRPQDFACGDEYAREMRELTAPARCHGGENCWRIHGARYCSPSTGGMSNRPYCVGCEGFIKVEDGRNYNGGKGRKSPWALRS